MLNKHKRWFHSSRVKFPLVRKSASWFCWNSEVHVRLVHHHSFTKFFIVNVERIAFMRRTYSRYVFRIRRIKKSNWSHRSFMSLFNIETLSVFKWTCLDYICLNKSSRSCWRTEFSATRINIDLPRQGRVSFILHVIKSPGSVTNWIWSWLGWLENFACQQGSWSSRQRTGRSERERSGARDRRRQNKETTNPHTCDEMSMNIFDADTSCDTMSHNVMCAQGWKCREKVSCECVLSTHPVGYSGTLSL